MNAPLKPGGAVRLESLTRHFGSHVALNALDLAIEPGEFFTLFGPSGSGKTTTLMLIAGFIDPSGGEIYIGERAMSRVPPHHRNVGIVFQNYSLFPHMSVADNVAFPLQMRGFEAKKIQRQVAEMLERVQLSGFSEKLPAQLSGGQQQRVALARALVYKPDVLLLDEPLSALDKSLREQMQREIRDLHQALGTTIILVTHDQSEALGLSDRIAILNEGQLQQIGAPVDLYENPRSVFVATFVGDSNVFPAQLIGSYEREALLLLDGSHKVRARPVSVEPSGAECDVVIRPQHVRVGPSARSLANVYEGKIRSALFGGNALKLEIAISDELTLVAWIPDGQLAPSSLGPGTAIEAGFDSAHAMTFPRVTAGGC